MAPKPPKTYILCLHICDHRSILLDEQKTLNRIQKARQQHLCDSPDLPLSDISFIRQKSLLMVFPLTAANVGKEEMVF